MSGNCCLSTGVIKKSPNNVECHIDIVNLSCKSITACCLAFNWDTNPPTALTVNPGSPIVIPENSNQSFVVDLSKVKCHYEIRIHIPFSPDIIANVFALNADDCVVAGNTVLFEDLVPISSCLSKCCGKKCNEFECE